MVYCGFQRVYYGLHRVFYGFCRFSVVFIGFSMVSYGFSMVFSPERGSRPSFTLHCLCLFWMLLLAISGISDIQF